MEGKELVLNFVRNMAVALCCPFYDSIFISLCCHKVNFAHFFNAFSLSSILLLEDLVKNGSFTKKARNISVL